MAGENSTNGMTAKERAVVLGTFALLVSCALLLLQSSPGSVQQTTEVVLMTVSWAAAGWLSTLPRLLRGLLVGPAVVGATEILPKFVLGWNSALNDGPIGEALLGGALICMFVDWADPPLRLRSWATAGRARWLLYYGACVPGVLALVIGSVGVAGGVVNLFMPIEWLRDGDYDQRTMSIEAIVAGCAILSILGLLRSGSSWASRRFYPSSKNPLPYGGSRGEAANHGGLPYLSWSQTVATNDTVASTMTSVQWTFLLCCVAFCAVAGGVSSGPAGAIVGALAAFFVGSFGLRGAGTLKFQGGTLEVIPHTKTDAERREEITPMSRREDVEVFVEQRGSSLYFCVARGDKASGPLPIVEVVPWDSFQNFEEGSHKQWFRSRGVVDERLDWDVIIAQSSVGRVVRVAESIDDHAWLVELLVNLQNTFIVPREAMLKSFRDATAAKSGANDPASSGGPAAQAVPVKPF